MKVSWHAAAVIGTASLLSTLACADASSDANANREARDVRVDDQSLTVAASTTVFDDQMQNGFTDGSWGGIHNGSDSRKAHSGSVSMSFVPNNWNGLQWNHGSTYPAGTFTAIDFWANGGDSGNQSLWVGVTGSPKGTYRVPLAKYGTLQANTWTHFTVPVADLGASAVGITTVYIMDATGNSQGTVFVDDVALIPAGGGNTPNTPSPSGGTGAAGWLSTRGNTLYTSDGKPFHGRGANIMDTRGCDACVGTNVTSSAAEVNRRIDLLVDGWKANFLRLDLDSDNSNSGKLDLVRDSAYLAAIKSIVDHIATKPGVYVEVSMWHDSSLDGNGWPTANGDAQWRKLVDTFANYPQVLFGLSNEPENNYNGAQDSQVWSAMNDRAAAIRAQEALYGSNKHIIVAQGTGGWSRFLSYYQTHPLTAGGGSNFAYEVHVYDAASTFNDRFINPAKTIPVIIGEFGPTTVGATMTLSDCTTLMQQAEASGVPYLGWTFHMRCPPNLIQDNSSNGCGIGMNLQPTDWGNLLKNRLAQGW